jgi:hypothetical protein
MLLFLSDGVVALSVIDVVPPDIALVVDAAAVVAPETTFGGIFDAPVTVHMSLHAAVLF